MDKIFLRSLEANISIGVFEWEKQIRQKIYIDIEIATNATQAAQHDQLDDTLDYKRVAKYIQDFAAKSDYRLLETLVHHLAQALMEEFNIKWLRLCVNKGGAIRGAKEVGILIERGDLSTD